MNHLVYIITKKFIDLIIPSFQCNQEKRAKYEALVLPVIHRRSSSAQRVRLEDDASVEKTTNQTSSEAQQENYFSEDDHSKYLI